MRVSKVDTNRKKDLNTRILFLLFGYLFIGSAHAGAGWTDYASVDELNPTDLHYYVVRINVTENPSRCDNKIWFYQDYDRRGAEKSFSVLLEALASGKRVRVYVTGKCNLHDQSEISSVSIVR